MRYCKQLALFGVAAALCACAGNVAESSTDDEGDDDSAYASSSAALTALDPQLPAEMTDIIESDSVRILGCRYTAGTARDVNPASPRVWTWIHKTAVYGHFCRNTGYRVVNLSYARSNPLKLARHPIFPLLVIAGNEPGRLGGAVPSRVWAQQLDFRDLSLVRNIALIAFITPPTPQGPIEFGWIALDEIDLDLFGTLTITGSLRGIIPGMTGSGSHFQASYRHFVFVPRDQTVVPTIVAY